MRGGGIRSPASERGRTPSRTAPCLYRTAEGVCVFLDSVAEAEDLAEEGVVEVDGAALACRPYRADSHRVRLSDCPPFLPDCDIVAQLRPFGQVRDPGDTRVTPRTRRSLGPVF